MNRISSNYEENVQWFNDVLGAGRSCDMVCRDLYVGGRRARFWVIDGFGGDAILERMGAFWLSLQPEAVQGLTEMQQFADRYVTFMEVNVSYDRDDIVTSVLMGKSLLVMEGLSGAALIDAKEYPSRSVGEPPRWTWPRMVARVSMPVRAWISLAISWEWPMPSATMTMKWRLPVR